MSTRIHAQGVMAMLVERFEAQQLERLLELKAALEDGELLADDNSAFLSKVFEEARRSKHLVDRHPEYQALYARTVRLYKDIAEQALENEMRAVPQAGAYQSASEPWAHQGRRELTS